MTQRQKRQMKNLSHHSENLCDSAAPRENGFQLSSNTVYIKRLMLSNPTDEPYRCERIESKNY